MQASHAHIRDLIVEGRLAPGDRVVETDLAEQMDVSRGTVRRALEQLRHEGYLTQGRPGRQSRLVVAPVSAADAAELYSLLAEIEGLAVRKLAQASVAVRMRTADALAQLEARISDPEQQADDPSRFVVLDEQFHWIFTEAGGGSRTISLHKVLRPQLARYARFYTGDMGSLIATARPEHREIIAGIRVGDSDSAYTAVLANWHNGAKRVAGFMR